MQHFISLQAKCSMQHLMLRLWFGFVPWALCRLPLTTSHLFLFYTCFFYTDLLYDSGEWCGIHNHNMTAVLDEETQRKGVIFIIYSISPDAFKLILDAELYLAFSCSHDHFFKPCRWLWRKWPPFHCGRRMLVLSKVCATSNSVSRSVIVTVQFCIQSTLYFSALSST